jgi:hypothetical protein
VEENFQETLQDISPSKPRTGNLILRSPSRFESTNQGSMEAMAKVNKTISGIKESDREENHE